MPEPPPGRAAMIVLAYLWLLAIIPLLLTKDDPDVQWHAKHGLVLMVAELLLFTVVALVTAVVSLATFGAGCVIGMAGVFLWIGILGLHLTAMIKGLNGTRLLVPGVSSYANRF